MNNATVLVANGVVVPSTGFHIAGGVVTKDFVSSTSAYWNPSSVNVSYSSGWNLLTNTSYSASASGGGGLAAWLPQNPNGLVWDNNGQIVIKKTGKYAIGLWLANVYTMTGGSTSSPCQVAVVVASSSSNTNYNQVASVSGNSAPSEGYCLASGCSTFTGEIQATNIVPLTVGTVIQTNVYNGTGATKTVNFNVQLSIQLIEAYF